MTIHPRTFQNFICLLSKVSSNSVNVGRIGGGGRGRGQTATETGLVLRKWDICGGSLKKEREEAESGAGRAGWEGEGWGGGQELEPRGSRVHTLYINVH